MSKHQNTSNLLLDPSLYRVEFKAMGSACEIVIAAESQSEALRCIHIATQEIDRIEKKYSRYQDTSLISKINAAAGLDWVECDDETLSLFDYADKLFKISDGLFDITSGVMRRVWDFKKAVIPDQQQIDSVLGLVGWSSVERKNALIKLPLPHMEVDFGGFGKEYGVDRASTLLANNGIRHGFVNLGGDLRVLGPKPGGEPWVMAIKDPSNREAVIANMPVSAGALATSGDYEKFFDFKGRRYCHIISPKTGYPVNFWRSVSLLAPLSVTAGTYTTIAMLKEQDGLDWLKQSGLSYLAIDLENTIHKINDFDKDVKDGNERK